MKLNLTQGFLGLLMLLSTDLLYAQSYPIPSKYTVAQQVEHDFDRDGKKDLCMVATNHTILLFLSRDFKKTKTFQKYEFDDTGVARLFVEGDTLLIETEEGMSAVINHKYYFYYNKKQKEMLLTKCDVSCSKAMYEVIAEIDISTQTYHIKYMSEEETLDITEKYTGLPEITFKNLQEHYTSCRQLIFKRIGR